MIRLKKRFAALTLLMLVLGIAAGCNWPWKDDDHDSRNAEPEEVPVWATVSSGGAHVAAVKSNGTLWVWGANAKGQLGLGTWVDKNVPVQVDSNKWEAAAAGDLHTFAVMAGKGSVYSWGYGFDGQLANPPLWDYSNNTPIMVTAINDWASVSAGGCRTAVLKDDGTLWACGVIRDQSDSIFHNDPVRYPRLGLNQIGTEDTWAAVHAGYTSYLALKSDGTLWAWGDNDCGQLGDGFTVDQESPVEVGNASDWSREFSAGGNHGVAIKADGSLWAWGLNDYGQLGDGTQMNRLQPVLVDDTHTWKSVSAGLYHTLAIREDGTLWAWGCNSSGQLGNGTNTSSAVPVQVGTAADWVTVSAGWYFSAGMRSGGSLWTWGDNYYGQLGNGTSTSSTVPVQVGGE